MRDILTVYEATVRNFDQSTGVATVVMPGPYGMEPIEAAPFAYGNFDPYTIEPLVVGSRVLVTMSDNQPPEWLSTNSDWMGRGDDRWVNIYGDRMKETLEIVAGIESLRLGRYGSTSPHMGFYNDDFTTRYAYIMGASTDLRLVHPAGTVGLWGGGSVSLSATAAGVTIPNPNILDFGSSTRQMLNLYGATYGIGVQSSTLYLRTSAGLNMYRGGVHSNSVGDPGSGGVTILSIRADGVIEGFARIQGPMRAQVGTAVWGNGAAYLQYYDGATDADTLGTRTGYIGMSGGDMYMNNETGANTRVLSGSGVVILGIGSTERMRIDTTGVLMVGRTSNAAYYTDAGMDLRQNGQWISTCDTVNVYPWLVRTGGAIAASQRFLSFRTGISGTGAEIGTITYVDATHVAFNTTSHGPFKGNVVDLDDDEALERLGRWRPIAYQWKLDEDGFPSEEGEPQGPVQHGFIAQEMWEVNPSAVTPGEGTWQDHLDWRVRFERFTAEAKLVQEWEMRRDAAPEDDHGPRPLEPEDPGDSPFKAWMGDWSDLVPDIVAAMQAVLRKVEAQADEIQALQVEVAELRRSAPSN